MKRSYESVGMVGKLLHPPLQVLLFCICCAAAPSLQCLQYANISRYLWCFSFAALINRGKSYSLIQEKTFLDYDFFFKFMKRENVSALVYKDGDLVFRPCRSTLDTGLFFF